MSSIILTFLLTVLLILISRFEITHAQSIETITISSDGSVLPPTAPIQRAGNVYTLTEDISVTCGADQPWSGFIIGKDDIIIDGEGHSLIGPGHSTGFYLQNRNNVTIRNIGIMAFNIGIYIYESGNNLLSGNNITAMRDYGIDLEWSSHNTIAANVIVGNGCGIRVQPVSRNNTITENNITNNGIGLNVQDSDTNITSNDFASNGESILFAYVTNNLVAWNRFTNDGLKTPWPGNIIRDNSVNGKPLVYLDHVSGYVVQDAGQVILQDCENITVKDVDLSSTTIGLTLCGTRQSRITNNRISGNSLGIWLRDCVQCEIFCNNITENTQGIGIQSSSNNSIYHNNFIENTEQVITWMLPTAHENAWDHGLSLGGNFWSNYIGTDSNGDGIGDSPYVIDMENRDGYPLISPCQSWIPTHISISTSSSAALLSFAVGISGSLSDSLGSPLKEKTVVLQYTFPGANNWIPISSDTTDSLGRYSVEWMPQATGSYIIRAEWSGDPTYFYVTNSTTLSTLSYEDQYVFSIESNSTISELVFNSTSQELHFFVSGPTGTNGYVRATIAKNLLPDISKVRVSLNGSEITCLKNTKMMYKS